MKSSVCHQADQQNDPRLDSLPHRPPMRLITGIVDADPAQAGAAAMVRAEACVLADNPFLLPDGCLSRVALAEMLAQAFVAVSATLPASDREEGEAEGGEAHTDAPRPGYLVGMKNVHFYADARLGDRLLIEVAPASSFMDFVLFEGTVSRIEPDQPDQPDQVDQVDQAKQATLLADGELRLYLPSGSQPEAGKA